MKSLSLAWLSFLLTYSAVFGQATFTTTGSWNTASNWSGSNIGDIVTENVTINNNRAALINNGFTYTIGNLTFGNSGGLTINSTGVLNVGDASNSRDLTAGNGASITVTGTLIIWGDLIVINTLSLNVSGTLIVKGNIQMNNGASISVTGSVDVDGDFIGGNNTNVTISGGGGVNVDGSVNVGQNSNLTGPPGSFTAGGCGQGSGSNFCTGGVLPVDLLYFRAQAHLNHVKLSWATASELNSSYFTVEKSTDGITFQELTTISAKGISIDKVLYEVEDEKPWFGKSYYRLKQTDVDGATETFNIVLVEFSGSPSSIVYPSHIGYGENLTLELNFIPQQPLHVAIYDTSGKILSRFVLNNSTITLPVQWQAGVYLVRIASPEYQGINRFLVRE